MAILQGKSTHELRAGDQADLFVLVEQCASYRTRHGDPFFVLDVGDRSGTAVARVFQDQPAFEACRQVRRRDVIKIRALVDRSGPPLELKVQGLRVVSAADGVDLASLAGPLPAAAERVAFGTVAFDIETTPRLPLEELPDRERLKVQRWAEDDARRETGSEYPGDDALAESVRKALALNPLTNRVVSIAFRSADTEAEVAVVAAQEGAGDEPLDEHVLALGEAEMLALFWTIARRARTLVGFNSRRFDVPVLLTRSALLGVPAGPDLLSDRYDRDAPHLDLMDILSGRGSASDRRISLELASFAFGIRAKTSGHGSEVWLLVEEGRYEELAEYNLEDARATAALYQRLRGTWV